MDLHGKVLVVAVAAGVAFVRTCWKPPLCPVELQWTSSSGANGSWLQGAPAAGLMAKPIRDSGSTSGVTYFRRGKLHKRKLQLERGVRIRERSRPADTRVSDAGGEGHADIPLHLVVHSEAAHGSPQ